MKKTFVCFSLVIIFILSGCANDQSNSTSVKNPTESKQHEMDHSQMNHSNMDHSSSDELPKGLKNAINPKYKVGSRVRILDSHMTGMKGSIATIVGAYDTTAYIVSYNPTTGGPVVKDHKWVIQEEIQNASNQPLKKGTAVKLNADHMKGMQGATAIIESEEKTTVYMVDYTPTTGGPMVKNHKWVTEEELSTN
ncbi:YdhK family protein [Shimazuella sp. AN120528]|uniref:YdhK family protein n=1 Tax=Shimazuella soli TaxID=1892854 RepID=UPI001F0D7FFE|nr:YdhK family protein [Shimazuella soli]MCH5586648.1 YdhK family protein [Shimazuella soli]